LFIHIFIALSKINPYREIATAAESRLAMTHYFSLKGMFKKAWMQGTQGPSREASPQ
jgi:hypothetical protein